MKMCADFMSRELKWVLADASAAQAARLMRDNSIGFLPVCEVGSGRVIGVVTDRDLATRVCAEERSAADTPVSAIATRPPVACYEDDRLRAAEDLMRTHQVSRLVVVDEDGHPVGVISLSDVVAGMRGGRAMRTARAIFRRQSGGPQPPIDRIELTPSQPDEEAAGEQPSGGSNGSRSRTAFNRDGVIVGGTVTGGMREFPR
jgi:CBS domain-containing protein